MWKRPPYYRILKDVESYISDLPDSAYMVLSKLGKYKIGSKRVLAKYALLRSLALDKKYIDVTKDTLIRPAVLWYEKHGSDRTAKELGFNCRSIPEAVDEVIGWFRKEKIIKWPCRCG